MDRYLDSVHIWRVWRRSYMKVAIEGDVGPLVSRVLKLSTLVRGPQLMDSQVTIVTVSDSRWKEIVTLLLNMVENVIVDVSVPTANLLSGAETPVAFKLWTLCLGRS